MHIDLEDLLAIVQAAVERGRGSVVKSWNEADHPRGQPENAGEFAKTGRKTIPFQPAQINPWNRRKNGRDETSFNIGERVVDGVTESQPFFAEMQTVSPSYLDLENDDGAEGEFSSLVYDALDEHPKEYDFRNLHTEYGDKKDAFGLTGTGHAKEVISKSSQMLLEYLHRYSPGVVYFTAEEKSRASLYEFLASRIARYNQDYEPVKIDFHNDDRTVFALVKKDKLDDVMDSLDGSKIKVSAVVKKSLRSYPEVLKAWDESQHPRGDDGRFINKGEISAAAKSSEKAAELRSKVTDPAERRKLDNAIADTKTRTQFAQSSEGFGRGLGKKRGEEEPPSRQPFATSTLGEHPNGHGPDVHETVALARGLRSGVFDEDARTKLAEHLDKHTRAELDEIRQHLGLRPGGRKSELASKIILAASGHEYPEQGFTGVLPMKDGSHRHYVDGVLDHVEQKPKDSATVQSRVTPEQAHAIIDHAIKGGKLFHKETREAIANMLLNRMSYRDIAELKNRLGLRASGRKEKFAQRIQHLIEARESHARLDPNHPANQPDPAGKLGSLAERLQEFEAKKALYGDGLNPARTAAVQDAAERLRLAVDSPFSAFGSDAALDEAKGAINDLYNTPEFLAAARIAGLHLDPKDGKPAQQIGAAVARMAAAKAGTAEPSKPTSGYEPQDQSRAEKHTHTIEPGQPGVSLDSHRDDIKRAGGAYDKVRKKWTIDEEGLQYLPKELRGQPITGRNPKANPEQGNSPKQSKTVDVPPVEPSHIPGVPASAVKEAEEFKKMHLGATRHDVEYDQMSPWTGKMLRDGDHKTRVMASNRIRALIRKYPDLFTDYGHFASPTPRLPAKPNAAEHLAKYGADANPSDVIKDFVSQGGHPGELYLHLNPEPQSPGGGVSRTSLSRSHASNFFRASEDAHRAIAKHFEGMAPKPMEEPKPETAQPEPHTRQVEVNYSEAMKNRAELRNAGAKWNPESRQWTVTDDGAKKLPPHLRTTALDEGQRLKEKSAEQTAQMEKQRAINEEQERKREAEYRENVKDPAWVESEIKRRNDRHARFMQGQSLFSGNRSADEAFHAEWIAQLKADHEATKQPAAQKQEGTPAGNTDHLQAVASSAGHDEMRDAADTVSRIEDIPVGERTADDRAELKRAKELAGAAEIDSSSSTGPKNPEKYVDDHPEVTADNPLGLPTNSASPHDRLKAANEKYMQVLQDYQSGKASEQDYEAVRNEYKTAEKEFDSAMESGGTPDATDAQQPDETAIKRSVLETKMAEAKAASKDKSKPKGDRDTWARHHDELEEQRNALAGSVRTLADHERAVARAKSMKDQQRLDELKKQEPAVHAEHIDQHLAKLDKRIARMDEANSWAKHVKNNYGKVLWDSEMETVYGTKKHAIENGFPRELIADPDDGGKHSSIDQIAQQMIDDGKLHVPSDRNDTDYLIEKMSSGETFDGTHDDHRQALASERESISRDRGHDPETDAAIVEQIKEGRKRNPSAKPAEEPKADAGGIPADSWLNSRPTEAEIVSKQPHEMTYGEFKELPENERKKLNHSGYISRVQHARLVADAIRDGKDVRPEVYENSVEGIVASGEKRLNDKYGHDWQEKIKNMATGVATINQVMGIGGDANEMIVRRKQTGAHSFDEHEKGQIVYDRNREPRVIVSASKPYVGRHDGNVTGYFQKIKLRDIKPKEKAEAERKIAAYLARLHGGEKGNLDYADLKKKQWADYESYIDKALKNDPDAPDTSTTHGKPSAVPIGVTDKDDFESRGKGVQKSVDLQRYELCL